MQICLSMLIRSPEEELKELRVNGGNILRETFPLSIWLCLGLVVCLVVPAVGQLMARAVQEVSSQALKQTCIEKHKKMFFVLYSIYGKLVHVL